MGRFILIAQKPKRGKARPTAQLSPLQRSILVWLFSQEQTLGATDSGKRSLQKIGIPWNGKRFVRDQSQKSKNGNDTDRQTVSAALAGLARRELIVKLGLKTSHVKMTQAAREAACYQIQHGMTPRQRYDEIAKTYRMPAYYRACDVLAKLMDSYNSALSTFPEPSWAAGARGVTAGHNLEFANYMSGFERDWGMAYQDYLDTLRRCESVPYNDGEIQSAHTAFSKKLKIWQDAKILTSVLMR